MGAATPSPLRHLHKRPCSPFSSLSVGCVSSHLGGPPPGLLKVPTGPHSPGGGGQLFVPAPSPEAPSSWASTWDSGEPGPEALGAGAGQQAPGRLLLWWLVPERIIFAAALLLFLLAKCVGVQQAFAGERRQKIKLFKLQFCRQIERPPNSSELPNLDPSTHLPPRKW